MKPSSKWNRAVFAGCLGVSLMAFGQPTTAPSNADTEQEVRELREQVRELQRRLDAISPAGQRTEQQNAGTAATGGAAANGPSNGSTSSPPPSGATSEAAIAKPSAHSPNTEFAPQGGTSGEADGLVGVYAGFDPDHGFIIRSRDDSFLLHPWAFIQVRNATTYRSRATATTGADTENGFELPRAKFILDGNVFTRDLTYQFIWATSDTTGNLGLQDAWVRYHLPQTPFALEAGQIRDPVDHEQYVFATKSLTPDRSIVNNVLLNGDDIVKGLELSYGYDTNADARGLIAVTSGERNFDTSFEDYPTNGADWGIAGRMEWKLLGDWRDYAQFTSLGDKHPLLVLGGGADYTEAGSAGAFTHVADLQYNTPEGTSFYAAYLGRYTRNNAGPPTTNGQPPARGIAAADTYDATVRLMAAQLFDEHFEPFVRYEYLQFDPREFSGGVNSTVHDFTLGFNYYFYGHRAKFTGGASYLPNGSPVGNTISDLLSTHRGEEFIIQAQFQLML